MSEKILRKALEEAHSRLGLIFTAEERGFGMCYIRGCALAGCREIAAALAASPAPMGPDLREALKRYGRHDDTCLRRQIGVFSADPECDCGLDAILSALAVSFAPSTPAVQTGEREKEASG